MITVEKFNRPYFQGDLMLIRVESLDTTGMTEAAPQGGKHVLAHSETGHHHTVPADAVTLLERPSDEFAGAMQVLRDCAVVHERGFDTHEALNLPKGSYIVRRQREYTPEGYRRAQD